RHGALRLTEKCRVILRGEQKLELRKQSKEEKIAKKAKQNNAIRPQDLPLWEALRTLRTTLAEQHGVPSFVIFHDATLQEMVRKRPQTLSDFSRISGVGEQKLARYGQKFVDEISQYPLSELLDNRLSETVNETLVLYQQDLNVEQIAQQRDIKTSTIYAHLADAIEVGLLDVREVIGLEDAAYKEIVFLIESLEDEDKGRLKPVYDALDGLYDYGVLKCVQATI
ncbi:MAG TPA: ATP-dependent DNA helicase RecQ, partial [Methylophaga sp.]|nr:ATP-dependent DNA helicase RecQ [Methylophaga sp.]